MILDGQNLASDGQNLAQAIGTYVSTNSIDLGAPGVTPRGNTPPQDVGRSRGAEFFAQVVADFTSGGAGTLQINLIESPNADLSAPTILQSTVPYALADLKKGFYARLSTPLGFRQRYCGFQYVIAAAAMTGGNVTAGVAMDLQSNIQA